MWRRKQTATGNAVATQFATRAVAAEQRSDGAWIVRSKRAGPEYQHQAGDYLRKWAKVAPKRIFLAERDQASGKWVTSTYAQTRKRVDGLSQALLDSGHSPLRPIAALSGNSVRHVLLMLAAMQVGIPFVSVSAAYSAQSADFKKLRHVLDQTRPSALYLDHAAPFVRAIRAVGARDCQLIVDDVAVSDDEAAARRPFEDNGVVIAARAERLTPRTTVDTAYARVGPASIAKILMTSGSTGAPKGVIVTQGTMWANGAAVDLAWPFLARRPPVLLDWLPLSHTFASNFNLPQIMRHGGTLYLDAGRPSPGLIDTTLQNLREIRPTLLYNVPRGYELLAAAFEQQTNLAVEVFSNLDLIFYAGAHLPTPLWRRLDAIATKARGARIPISTSLGSTETGPVATLIHWSGEPGNGVGDPVAGTVFKIVRRGEKQELRVKGPSVTPGYFNDPMASANAFDEEGFFLLGDAVTFIDGDPRNGLRYDGRLSENFKLLTGSWVHVGALRQQLLDALAPLATEVVIAGENRDALGILIFPHAPACRDLTEGNAPADLAALCSAPSVQSAFHERLAAYNANNPGASSTIGRAVLVADSPSIDRGELTDKGYLNQRGTLASRKHLVAALYAQSGQSIAPDVLISLVSADT